MCLFVITKTYLARNALEFWWSNPKRNPHHGENIHKMQQVPENPTPKGLPKSADLLKESKGNLPPAEIKRITHPTAKQQAKKPSNKTKTEGYQINKKVCPEF
jgi:hypothetical protein